MKDNDLIWESSVRISEERAGKESQGSSDRVWKSDRLGLALSQADRHAEWNDQFIDSTEPDR